MSVWQCQNLTIAKNKVHHEAAQGPRPQATTQAEIGSPEKSKGRPCHSQEQASSARHLMTAAEIAQPMENQAEKENHVDLNTRA